MNKPTKRKPFHSKKERVQTHKVAGRTVVIPPKAVAKKLSIAPKRGRGRGPVNAFATVLAPQPKAFGMVRINKHMADIGLASRREADEFVSKGIVFVNGKKAVMGMQIDPKKDKVTLQGKKPSYVYYMYNKPIGIVTTGAQGEEEDILSVAHFPTPVFPVGRLDKESHGLLLMTNDRRITHRLLDPKFEHEKEYRVTIAKGVTGSLIKKMENGMMIDDEQTKPTKIFRERDNTFRIVLTEGKNRQIRKMVEAAGDMVTDLLRIRIEHILLGDLQDGAFRSVRKDDVALLLKKLGLK